VHFWLVLQTHGRQSLQAPTTQSDIWINSTAAPARLAPSNAALTNSLVRPDLFGLPTKPNTILFSFIESLLVKINKHQTIISLYISYEIRRKSPTLPSYHHQIVLFGPQHSCRDNGLSLLVGGRAGQELGKNGRGDCCHSSKFGLV
jgi:hypothetical protein